MIQSYDAERKGLRKDYEKMRKYLQPTFLLFFLECFVPYQRRNFPLQANVTLLSADIFILVMSKILSAGNVTYDLLCVFCRTFSKHEPITDRPQQHDTIPTDNT